MQDNRSVTRRDFVGGTLAFVAATRLDFRPRGRSSAAPRAPAPRPVAGEFELEEITIAELQSAMQSGKYTAHRLVELYVDRIHSLDGQLRAVIELNPDALAIADQMDAERKATGARGPLHGIPMLIKDNIATGDKMLTTAGSLALASGPAGRDAFIADKLRRAGAVIIGKTNLSEWANFRSTHSSSGWSGRGGQCRNPYALDRSPSGSSSGSGAATAMNFAAASIGTETDGSITSPCASNSLVGIKPTLGLVSRAGIIPIAHNQDTAGPMCRTVADAAAVLTAIAGSDARDWYTSAAREHATDYTTSLDADGLTGARIGLPREHYYGYHPAVDALMEQAIDVMKQRGATIVDPANLATAGKFSDAEFDVLLYEFKTDLNSYLKGLGDAAPAKTLQDLIAWNEAHKTSELPYFGQEIFVQAQKKGPLTDPAYKKALAKCRTMSRAQGIDATMIHHKLDALVAPTHGPAWPIDLVNGDGGSGGSCTEPPAVAGYPHITLPLGYVRGLPVGISFFGRAWTEPTLIKLAYAFEQATKHRKVPTLAPTADLSV